MDTASKVMLVVCFLIICVCGTYIVVTDAEPPKRITKTSMICSDKQPGIIYTWESYTWGKNQQDDFISAYDIEIIKVTPKYGANGIKTDVLIYEYKCVK